MSLNIKYWGVRGSLPSSPAPIDLYGDMSDILQNFFKAGHRDPSHISQYLSSFQVPILSGYGVATTCVEVRSAQSQLIIDGGSGIRNLSDQIMSGTVGRGKGPFHIFMTHFHWDHVLGLPFFTPHFVPGIQIHYYAVQPELEKLIRGIFQKPYFPVPFEELSAKVHFHVVEPRKPFQIDDLMLTAYKLDHPDPCWGLKVQSGGKTYSHCMDTEGTRVTREELGPDLPLYQQTDLMYFDAQYTFPELAEKANWGHSAAQVGLEIAFRENIKKVLFAHHDPGAGVKQIEELKRQTQEYYDWRMKEAAKRKLELPAIDWEFAHEGLEVSL